MGKISLQDLSSVLVERRRIGKKEASQFVNEMFYLIQKKLNEEKIVKIKGLGTFKIIDVEDRESVDVNTGDRVLIEGHGKITFTPDALMKELVNKPFSQFETVVLKDGVEFEEEPAPEVESGSEAGSLIEIDDSYENPSAAPLVEFVTDTSDEEEVFDEPVEPKVEAPVVEEPVVEPPVVEEPEEETSVEVETPVEEEVLVEENVPVEETPIEEAPVEDHFVEEPAAEEKSAEEPAEETSASEAPAEESNTEETPVEETPADEETTEDVYVEENARPWKWILMVLAACIVGFIAGYLVGKNAGTKVWTPDETYQQVEKPAVDSLKPAAKQEKAVEPAVEAEQTAKDSVKTAAESPQPAVETTKPEETTKPAAETAKPAAPAQETAKPAETAKAEEPVVLDKYEQMDSRVRTGAYRILGTDHMEKVKAGDNLTRICNRTIGKGMECYLEVYNGFKPDVQLKEGQEIKIPKLELKKKKAKKVN